MVIENQANLFIVVVLHISQLDFGEVLENQTKLFRVVELHI